MKDKFSRPLAFISTMVILASTILPGGLVNPADASAGPGIMKWDTVTTPNSEPGKNDVLNPYFATVPTGSEVRDLAVGSDGRTLLAAVTVDGRYVGLGAVPVGALMVSANGGISWTTTSDRQLRGAGLGGNHVYNVLIAPDDPKLWAVTAGTTVLGPTQFWVTEDAGVTWSNTNAPVPGVLGEAIGAIDISPGYGNGRDFMFATRSGNGAGRIFILKSGSFGTWMLQSNPSSDLMDFFAVKFSPTYSGDQSIVVILADSTSTFYNIGVRDINANSVSMWVYTGNGISIASQSMLTLTSADLSLPSDFSGQTASLRRAFVSLVQTGIYRIDDSVPTSLLPRAGINSIAFFGTYASGKLLAGSLFGYPCNATVPTVFMDTPCTCAGSCSIPSLKPPTGAASQSSCSDSLSGIGSAVVAWSPNGSLAYAVTGSATVTSGATWWNAGSNPWIAKLIPNDESAFSISRNNGDTWNQLSLIDTTIDWFNDVAVSADCTTVYLASVHRNVGTGCNEFDSVWRSTVSPAVASPLPTITPIGSYWERVLTHTTSATCNVTQTDLPLLRTVPSCTDSSNGGIVAWAAQYAPASLAGNGGVMAWSPDYGDYWTIIGPRNIVQDFTFESSRVIYSLSPVGMVQKLVYTGTAWSTTIPSSFTGIAGHTIVARNGKVLVGAALSNQQEAAVAYSLDSAKSWYTFKDRMPSGGNMHVIFDVDFEKNYFVYAAADDNITGAVYRNTAPSFTRWDSNNMMDISNGATGPDWWNDGYSQTNGDPPHQRGYYGLVMAFTGNAQPTLYAAHDNITTSLAPGQGGLPSNSAVCRTLEPRNGMPKPGIYWDCLDIYVPPNQNDVHFTLEPSSLKACGCCSPNTNTALWAIDKEYSGIGDNFTVVGGKFMSNPGYNPEARQGMLWAYTDCLAKKGPSLRTPPDQALVGADPVTGRNQQVDLSWEQLCLSNAYYLQVAKDKDFTLRINPAVSNASNIDAVTGSILIRMDQNNVTSPAVWLAPGSLPEAGAIYYWRVRSYQSATGQIAVSPWSDARSFTVKAGFIVNTPYYGVQLLAPDNGCMGCKTKPASFSWSPWKEAIKYEFVLAKDTEFNQVMQKATTISTGYEYVGTLEYGTNYFWRVRAVEINGQPISSDWSATFSFQTEPVPPLQGILKNEPGTPLWVWAVIGIGTVLVIVTLVLILRTRRKF